jgi:hypothetical protein
MAGTDFIRGIDRGALKRARDEKAKLLKRRKKAQAKN